MISQVSHFIWMTRANLSMLFLSCWRRVARMTITSETKFSLTTITSKLFNLFMHFMLNFNFLRNSRNWIMITNFWFCLNLIPINFYLIFFCSCAMIAHFYVIIVNLTWYDTHFIVFLIFIYPITVKRYYITIWSILMN